MATELMKSTSVEQIFNDAKCHHDEAKRGDRLIYSDFGFKPLGYWLRDYSYHYKMALEKYTHAAQAEHIESCYILGQFLEFGWAGEQDYDLAIHYYQKAADTGHIRAQYRLGEIFRYSEHQNQDNESAAYWFMKAATQGYPEACYQLGLMHQHLLFTDADIKQALYWYQYAARQGHVSAQYNLAWLFHYGQGCHIDLQQAIIWYVQAARKKDKDALFNIAELHIRGVCTDDYQQDLEWLHLAAQHGHAGAQKYLGCYYYKRRENKANLLQSYIWLGLALEFYNSELSVKFEIVSKLLAKEANDIFKRR